MNIIIKLIFCLIINTLVCDSKTIENNNNENILDNNKEKCLREDGSPGLCLVNELCNDLNISQISNCTERNTVCCPENNERKFSAFWSPINTFWNSLYNISTSPRPSTSSVFWPPIADLFSVCGFRNVKKEYGYIVGGNIAPPHSWPWAVAVYTSSTSSFQSFRFVCGATVISDRYVLGAAHCVSHNNRVIRPENIRLLIGAHDRRYEGIYYRVEKVIVHSEYDERIMQNDIALYRLVESLRTRNNVAPVCLPTHTMESRDFTRYPVYLVGWGTTSAGGQTSDYLRQVQVPIISNKECTQSYNSLMVTSKQMCAGYVNGQRDSCQGDSGGAMTVELSEHRNRFYQIGIVSWGKGCAEPKYPGVYTKVSAYIDWIHSNID